MPQGQLQAAGTFEVSLLASNLPSFPARRVRFTANAGTHAYTVRGSELPISPQIGVIDYYPPLGWPIVYQVETEDGQVLAATTHTVDQGIPAGMLSDAVNPMQYVPVFARPPGLVSNYLLVADGVFRERTYKADGQQTHIIGSRLPVWIGQQPRRGKFHFEAFFRSDTLPTLEALLDQPLLCLRPHRDWGLNEPLTYLPTDALLYAYRPWDTGEFMRLEMTCMPVRAPGVTPVVNKNTISQVDTDAARHSLTVNAVQSYARNRTVAEVDLRPRSLAGAG